MNMICFLRNYICDQYNTSFFDILQENIIDKDFDSKANVVVRNLPKDFDQKDLANLFS
jgi:hypothetical protein